MFHSARLLSELLVLLPLIALCDGANYTHEIDCNNLRMGQYICPHPDYDFIDPKTQQPRGCTKENKAKGMCEKIQTRFCDENPNLVIILFLTSISSALYLSLIILRTFKMK